VRGKHGTHGMVGDGEASVGHAAANGKSIGAPGHPPGRGSVVVARGRLVSVGSAMGGLVHGAQRTGCPIEFEAHGAVVAGSGVNGSGAWPGIVVEKLTRSGPQKAPGGCIMHGSTPTAGSAIRIVVTGGTVIGGQSGAATPAIIVGGPQIGVGASVGGG
jgi:hypothetical protein